MNKKQIVLILAIVLCILYPQSMSIGDNVDVNGDDEVDTKDGIEGMMLIPAGKFQMGSNSGSSDESPVHSVYVDAFYMDKYEVTNAKYAAFLNAKGEHAEFGRIWFDVFNHFKGRINLVGGTYRAEAGYEDHPVVEVSWYQAMAYASWADKRLPTEAEWEKAARGGLVDKTYSWGDTIDSTKANYNGNIGDTTPVGEYPANAYGLYDMCGNVWEWCLDEYQSDFYANSPDRNPIAGGASINDILDNYTTSTASTARVWRGGSWFNTAQAVAGR